MIYSVPATPRRMALINYHKTPLCKEIVGRVRNVRVPKHNDKVEVITDYYSQVMRSFEGLPNYSITTVREYVMLFKKTEAGHYLNLEDYATEDILQKTRVWEYKRPIDLGCGLGQVAALGAFFNKGRFFGVEYDYELIMAAEIAKKVMAKEIPLIGKTKFLWGNYMDLNFVNYDYFFFNGTTSLSSVLGKFANEAKLGSLFIVVSCGFQEEFLDDRVYDVSSRYNCEWADVYQKGPE